jgi:hypothetical protein
MSNTIGMQPHTQEFPAAPRVDAYKGEGVSEEASAFGRHMAELFFRAQNAHAIVVIGKGALATLLGAAAEVGLQAGKAGGR